jgi:hypothetical protein
MVAPRLIVQISVPIKTNQSGAMISRGKKPPLATGADW